MLVVEAGNEITAYGGSDYSINFLFQFFVYSYEYIY